MRKDVEALKGKMYFFFGNNIDVLKSIHKEHTIKSIYFNYDYTPFAKARDEEITKWGEKEGIEVCSF